MDAKEIRRRKDYDHSNGLEMNYFNTKCTHIESRKKSNIFTDKNKMAKKRHLGRLSLFLSTSGFDEGKVGIFHIHTTRCKMSQITTLVTVLRL